MSSAPGDSLTDEPQTIIARPVSKPRSAISEQSLFVLLAACVGILVAVTFLPAIRGQAVSFDDPEYVLRNPLVQNPSFDSVYRFFTEVLAPTSVKGYYQPLTMTSLMLDWAIGARTNNFIPFHFTSLLLHVGCTVLVITLAFTLFERAWPAALAGLMFGLHPALSECVPWISERKTLLASLFACASLVLYARWAKLGRRRCYILSLCLFIPALLAKPTVVMLPLLLLILDFWPLRRLGGKVLLEKIPFLLLAAASAIITYVSQANTSVAQMPAERSPLELIYVFCHNISFYLEKMLWPTDLSAHYPYPLPINLSQPAILAGVVGAGIIIVVLLLSLRSTRAVCAAALFFYVALIPTFGFIAFTDTIAAIRFTYFPAVGLVLALAALLCHFWRKAEIGKPRAGLRVCIVAAVALCTTMEAGLTRLQLRHWRDTGSLYGHMLAIAPDAPTLNYNVAVILFGQQQYAECIPFFEKVLKVQPSFAAAHADLGTALFQTGKFKNGEQHLKTAIDLQPDLTGVYVNLGILYRNRGRLDEAERAYRKAIELAPNFTQTYPLIAEVLVTRGRASEAVRLLNECMNSQPASADMYFALGLAQDANGNTDQAIQALKKAARMTPPHPNAESALRMIAAKRRSN